MSTTSFQVIAEAPTEDFGTLERIQKGLSRTFSIDLTPYRAKLRQGGVCVCRARNLEEAEQQAQQVRAIGANFRITDAQGRTVREGAGRLTVEAASGARRDDPPTLIGGHQQPNGEPPAPAPGRPPARSSTFPAVIDPALMETMMRGQPTPAPAPSAAQLRNDDSLDFLTPGAVSPAPVAKKMDLDALDAADLVLLDGTKDDEPQVKPAAAAMAIESLSGATVASSMSFAPPVNDDAELELEEIAAPRGRTTAAPSVGGAPVVAAPGRPARPTGQEVSTVPTAAPPTIPSRTGASSSSAAPPTIPPRGLASSTAPRAPAVAESDAMSGELPAAAAPDTGALAPIGRPRPAPRPRHVDGASLFSQQQGGRLFLGGWFRARPRLRIAVGFVLALGLGGVIPSCHARSVMRSRVMPQLEDLSTAKAHAPILSRLPNYRAPAEIEQAISDITRRNRFSTALLWLACASGLAFAWFRFA